MRGEYEMELCSAAEAAGNLTRALSHVNRAIGMYRVGQKTGPFLRVNNFARVNDRKACYTSKFCKFCLEESVKVTCQCIK